MKFTSALSTLPLIVMHATASNAWNIGWPSRQALALLNTDVPPMMDTPLTRMLREHDKLMDEAFSMVPMNRLRMTPWDIKNQPHYEVITNNENEFKVALDVPGMTVNDLHIDYDDENKMLKVTGSRESKGDGYMFSSKFAQSFSIDPTVDIDQFTAQLENGVLIIAAPKDVKKLEQSIRQIPIQSNMTLSTDVSSLSSNDTEDVATPIEVHRNAAATTTTVDNIHEQKTEKVPTHVLK
jgi:HSP20 family molecular chaperone IbpA